MQLKDLNLDKLEQVEYFSKQVNRIVKSGRPRPRHVYKGGNYFYKVWGENYIDHRTVFWKGKPCIAKNVDSDGKQALIGHLYGLYDQSVCAAFVENIYDGDRLAGYISQPGTVLSADNSSTEEVDRFVELLIKRSLDSGFVHRDFKLRNIIRLADGRLSLIDFDTPLVLLNEYSAEREVRSGSLAGFTLASYRAFIQDYLRPEAGSADIRAAQARHRSSPPPAFAIDDEKMSKFDEEGSGLMSQKNKRSVIAGLKLPSGEITPGKRSGRSLRKRNAMIACSFDLQGKRVLDVGCADGLHALYMSQSAREVYGVDHRSTEIEVGRATAKALDITNVRLEVGDIRDKDLFKDVGKFDLVMAWGFLHRVGDIFSLLYSLSPLADAISLEWRTPVIPLMSSVSLAYHPPVGDELDPMNVGSDDRTVADGEKIEGGTAFWEPTPGAVSVIAKRLGFAHSRVLGYGENLESEARTLSRHWNTHIRKANEGKVRLDRLPEARVHMLFERTPGSVSLKALKGGEARVPQWDRAFHKSLQR